MGCYAEVVRGSFPGAVAEPALPRGQGWVVLTSSSYTPEEVRRIFPSARRLILLTAGGEQHRAVQDVKTVSFTPGPPPALSMEAREALADGFGGVVLLDGIEGTSGRLLADLKRLRISHVAWRRGVGWHVTPIEWAILRKPLARLERSLEATRLGTWYRNRAARAQAHSNLRERNSQAWFGQREWLAHLERVGVRAKRPRSEVLKVMLYIGQLNSGGAERQFVNMALGLRRQGHSVRALTTYPMSDENAHYCQDLQSGGVVHFPAGVRLRKGVREALQRLDISPELVGSMPEGIRDPVLDLAGELLDYKPDVLHCWLDYPNIIGAAAAALVGTPTVILSARNVNPTWFPAFYQSWMDVWYERLMNLPQMHLLANSRQGADDYAKWLNVPRERFEVIYNGVDLASMTPPDAEAVQAFRAELGLPPGAPLVVGIFRLAQEKQPELFLEVIQKVHRKNADLRVALVGIGDMREKIVKSIDQRGLKGVVSLLGQRKDVPVILAAAEVMLLTSKVEGTPNVILEAQWAACPPVATAAGGTPDAMVDTVTGFVHDCADGDSLAESVLKLLGDDLMRAEMGLAGRRFVQEHFSLERLINATFEHYRSLLEPKQPAAEPAFTANGALIT